jgi:hypothetical protein
MISFELIDVCVRFLGQEKSEVHEAVFFSVMNLYMGSIHKPRPGRKFLTTYGESKKETRPWQSPFWTNIDFPKYDFFACLFQY